SISSLTARERSSCAKGEAAKLSIPISIIS
ncbi:MAG: hypothetical protein ACI8TS_001777, partial [Flavobacteriales bacterium]